MKLYNSMYSPNAKRVRVAAKECGVTLEIKEVDMMKGEHRSPEVLALNPNGKLPTVVGDDGKGLWESPALLLNLAWQHPEKNLVPTDIATRTEMAKWMFWNASHFEQAVFGIATEAWLKPKLLQQPVDVGHLAASRSDLDRFAPILNAQLEGKTWIVGSQFTVADIALGTTVEFGMLPDLGIDFSSYKHLGAWFGRLSARESWKA